MAGVKRPVARMPALIRTVTKNFRMIPPERPKPAHAVRLEVPIQRSGLVVPGSVMRTRCTSILSAARRPQFGHSWTHSTASQLDRTTTGARHDEATVPLAAPAQWVAGKA